jgi:hypothetical protein
MCLDPRPDRPFRASRPARRTAVRRPLFHAPQVPRSVPVIVRAPALHAIDHLAGDDDLVARGWVVLSREA